jgi:hypothetical protein
MPEGRIPTTRDLFGRSASTRRSALRQAFGPVAGVPLHPLVGDPGFVAVIGTQRDLTPTFAEGAHLHGRKAVLFEHPDILDRFNILSNGRRGPHGRIFDSIVPTENLSDGEQIADAVLRFEQRSNTPAAALIGAFEPYVHSSHQAATIGGYAGLGFATDCYPFTKDEQRERWLSEGVLQPDSLAINDKNDLRIWFDRHPNATAVLKRPDIGGSRGVDIVDDYESAVRSLEAVRGLANYGGVGARGQIIIEEFVAGPEFSVQGVADAGRKADGGQTLDAQTVALKYMERLPAEGENSKGRTRSAERAHVLVPAGYFPSIVEMLDKAVDAVGYEKGPVQADLIARDGDVGQPNAIEIGFRTSGAGLPKHVQAVSGYNMGARSLTAIFDGRITPRASRTVAASGQYALGSHEISEVRQLGRGFDPRITWCIEPMFNPFDNGKPVPEVLRAEAEHFAPGARLMMHGPASEIIKSFDRVAAHLGHKVVRPDLPREAVGVATPSLT